MDRQEIARRLRGIRGQMSRQKLAEHLGVSVTSIAYYETGQRVPSDPVKAKYADLFGISIDEVFFNRNIT